MSSTARKHPNILIVGTPGTGKSTLASSVVEKTPNFVHLNVGEIVRQHDFYESYDNERQCQIIDEERLLDFLEEALGGAANGGNGAVVEYHGCDFFPERWFDAVFVLRTDNTKLYDRLAARNYSESKIRENVECEIFGVLCEEAADSYKAEIVECLQSDTPEQMDENAERICQWISVYRNQHNGVDTY